MNFHIVFYDESRKEIARATKQVAEVEGYLTFDLEDVPAGAARWAFEIGDRPLMTEDEFVEKYGISRAKLMEANQALAYIDTDVEAVAKREKFKESVDSSTKP